MNQPLLCTWLGLAEKTWPPDHYAILGLSAGACDAGVIEQCVHERMAKLRCYQIAHPAEATEGMNRVAQAFIFLTEQASKNGMSSSIIVPPPPKPVIKEDTAVGRKTVIDWRGAPPPVRAPAAPVEAPPSPVIPLPTADPTPVAVVAPPPPMATAPPAPPPFDYLEALAQQSLHATRGIGTLPLLIERIEHTRRMLVAWLRLGKYLQLPTRKLASKVEEKDLAQKWNALTQHLESYPRFVAQPGRPGYRVAAFARLEMTALMFKSMGPDQRDDLARDWDTGRKVLFLHRTFLRQQFKSLRHQSIVRRAVHGMRGLVNDHPLLMMLGIGAAAALCGVLYWLVF